MSRLKIGVIVAGVIAVLTAAAYLLAQNRLAADTRRDVESKIGRAEDVLTRMASLESYAIIARAQGFARDEAVRRAIEDPAVREQAGREGVQRFLTAVDPSARKPDFVALVDGKGAVVVADSPLPDSDDLKSRFKAVAAALDAGQPSKDVWDYGKNTIRVGVAPVLSAAGKPVGAVIVAYALNAKEAVDNAMLLRCDVVFFNGDKVVATSFKKQVVDDLGKLPALAGLARAALAGGPVTPVEVELGGERYLAIAGALPLNFDNRTAGAIVLSSLDADRGQLFTVKVIILVLGLGALIVALFVMWVTARLIFHQSDEIEAGVTEIINGDADYVFKPVGPDFDGLANSLNVMLARLLGRPEPSEDNLQDAGASAGVMLAEADAAVPAARLSTDSDVVALAAEPEPQYLRRVYEEFVAARRAVGESVEGVTFESFSAKLRLSEANLRAKYGCKAVRFKVQTRDNQVTLKPVPIV